MINSLKPFEISNKDIDNLKNINPFWNKDFKKRVEKLKKWLIKFGQNELNFQVDFCEEYKDYPKMFKQIDHFKSFLNQKYDLIKSTPKILAKFQKLIDDYCTILGIIKSIEIFCEFYKILEKEDVPSRKILLINLTNDNIEKYLKIFLKEIEKILPNDKYILLCYENIVRSNLNIINSQVFLKNILRYSQILFRKKKINQKEFVTIGAILIEFYAFIREVSYITSRMSNDLY